AQSFLAEAGKAVWSAARFECAAADGARAGRRHLGRGALDLVAAFHAGGASDHDHPLAADGDIAGAGDGALGPEAAAGQPVRRDDAVRLFDALHDFEGLQVEIVGTADAAQYRMDYTGGAMDIEAHFDHAPDDGIDLFLGGALLHDH